MDRSFDEFRVFELTRGFDPDPAAFINSISTELTDEMLREIAGADWGHDLEENLVLLTEIRASGRAQVAEFQPHEVLSLCHWRELTLDSPRRQHLVRGLCSAALFQLAEQPEFGDCQTNWMYFAYTQSAIALGCDQAHAALRSIAATIKSPRDIPEIPNFGVAALVLLAGSAAREPHIASIVPELIDWASKAPSAAPRTHSTATANRLDLSDAEHAADRCRWRELAEYVAAHAASGWPATGPNRILLPSDVPTAPPAPVAARLASFAGSIVQPRK